MKPFSAIANLAGGLLASARAVQQIVNVLRGFDFTADENDIIIERTASGIHLRLAPRISGGGASGMDHPFKVTGGGGTFRISPGTVMTDNGAGETIFFTPLGPSGIPLDATFGTPTTFSAGAGATGYVCLRVIYSSYGGAISTPWQIVFSPIGSLAAQPLQRVNGYNSEGQNAIIDLPIAHIVLGEVKDQCAGGMIAVRFRWNDFEPGLMSIGYGLTS